MTAASFRHDPQRIGLVRNPDRYSGSKVRWDVEPAVDGVHVLTHTTSTGEVVRVPVCATPFAVPGVGMMVAAYDGRVMLRGERLDVVYWTRRLSAPVYADPVHGRVIVATTDGVVTCLDLRGQAARKLSRSLRHGLVTRSVFEVLGLAG